VKINLRILMQEDAVDLLRGTDIFSEDELASVAFNIDSQSERFARFVRVAKDASGTWFNPLVTFTKKELESAAYFEPQCRKTLAESNKDYDWNNDHVESLDFLETAAGMKIRLPDRIAISKTAALKFNMVAGVGQWTQEYVVHSDVATAFTEEGFSGFSLRPVFNSKTQIEQPDVHQLYSDAIMPPAELGRRAPPSDSGSVRLLGCLVYDDLEQHKLADFNRTAEDWAARDFPLWVVSARVREFFMRSKFKGWAFTPVIVKGSELHREYERLWDDLFDRVSVNPRNFF
jgi:hypothetical protein